MSNEQIFSEFFGELGGMDNLKLMVNVRNVIYGEVRKSPAVDFTLGWEKRAEFRVIKRPPSYPYECTEDGDNYFIYLEGVKTVLLVNRIGIAAQMSLLIKLHTGYEIFF